MKRIVITALCLAGFLVGVWYFAYGRSAAPAANPAHAQLRVVTTNSILEDLVHNVAQDRVDLHSIVQRGVDPHEYEPRPTDIAAATEADVLFHNGLNLETGGNGWFKKLVATAGKQFNEEVFAASAGVKPLTLSTNAQQVDPHAWLDLANGMQYVRTITAVLSQKDPANASFYRENATQYLAKLAKLHRRAQAQFQAIPAKQRVLVTSEGAFKYFAAAYQLTPAYIWEINTEAQGTPEQMQRVIATIRRANVRHLFVEASVSPKSMNKVAQETGLSIHSTVFTDSLAKRGSPGDTYYEMMAWNVEHIQAGLAE